MPKANIWENGSIISELKSGRHKNCMIFINLNIKVDNWLLFIYTFRLKSDNQTSLKLKLTGQQSKILVFKGINEKNLIFD